MTDKTQDVISYLGERITHPSLHTDEPEPVIINSPLPPPKDTLDKKAGRGIAYAGRKANKLANDVFGLWGTVFLASVLSSSATYVMTHHEHIAMASEPTTVQVQLAGAAEGNL